MNSVKKTRADKREPESLRHRTLVALAANRAPGFHFPGYFLQMAWPHIGKHKVVQTMQPGPHCVGTDGSVHSTVLGVLIDGALAGLYLSQKRALLRSHMGPIYAKLGLKS